LAYKPRLLVVSPPALDLLDAGARPGGPGLYAGAAFALMGGHAYTVGPVGYCTLPVVAAERGFGVERLGYSVAGPGYVNRLVYTGRGRMVSRVHGVPGLDPGPVLAAAGRYWWDAVLVSPLAGEDHGVPRILQGYARLVALDVQGYARGGLEPWLVAGRVQVLHAGDGEPWRGDAARIVTVTSGPGPVEVYVDGVLAGVYRPRTPIGDPTGAGDVFTGILLYGLARGLSPLEAVEQALDLVAPLLEEIHRRLDTVGAAHCG